MNKGIIIALVLGLVAVTAVGGYVMVNRTANNSQESNIAVDEVPETQQSEVPNSLRSLFSMTTNQQCNFRDEETQSEGIVYIGNGQVRGDFTTVQEGQSYDSNMYSDGESVYIWLNGQEKGYMISMDSLDSFGADESGNAPSLDFENEVDFDCTTWSPDTDVFDLPEDVEFQDFSVLIPANVGSGQGELPGVKMDCSTCDQLPPGDAQDQCKTSLSC